MPAFRTTLTALLTGSALTLLLVVPALGADLGLGEGARAPAFEGKEFVNTEPTSLQAMRGRLVLLELFSTT